MARARLAQSPYAQPLIAQFVSKMCAERKAGRVTAAIMLTHNYTDTAWFQGAMTAADAICFTRGRVKFYELDGEIAAPTQGQAFFLLRRQHRVLRGGVRAYRQWGYAAVEYRRRCGGAAMTAASRTTYAEAARGYSDEFERNLVAAITQAIGEASLVTDCPVMAIRTGETASALLSVLAAVLAMSPAAVRSPTALRKTIDELGKRLRRRVAAAQADQDVQDFARRCFRGSDVGGRA